MPGLTPASPATRARLYLVAGAVLWSTGGFFIKEIDAGATAIVMFRCLFGAAILAPLLPGRRLPPAGAMVLLAALMSANLGLYVASAKATTAANAVFLQYTAPLYVIALAPMLLGERLRGRDLPAFVICLGGIAVLFAGNAGSGDTGGLLMGAGSGLFYGLFLLALRRLRTGDPIVVTFLNCLGVSLVFLAIPGALDVDAEALLLLFVMGAVQFAIPYVLFTRGIRDVSGAEASLIALIEPALNPVWVALFYGENPSVATVIGGCVIIGGLVVRYGVLRPRDRETEVLEPSA